MHQQISLGFLTHSKTLCLAWDKAVATNAQNIFSELTPDFICTSKFSVPLLSFLSKKSVLCNV